MGLGGGLNRLCGDRVGCVRRQRDGGGVGGGDEVVVMDVGEGDRFEESEREEDRRRVGRVPSPTRVRASMPPRGL